jgi:hypothetical protein
MNIKKITKSFAPQIRYVEAECLLYLVDKYKSTYSLSVTNLIYTGIFVDMAQALRNHQIPFEAVALKETPDFFTGEVEVGVTTRGDLSNFHYTLSRENKKNTYSMLSGSHSKY